MVASDLAITKGNRGSIMDLASLGIPSISISSVLNPIDEALVARVRSNLALNVNAVDSRFLARCIEDAAGVAFGERDMPLNLHLRGGEVAAEALADEILRLVGHNGGAVQ